VIEKKRERERIPLPAPNLPFDLKRNASLNSLIRKYKKKEAKIKIKDNFPDSKQLKSNCS
jgi:hypothetical protein